MDTNPPKHKKKKKKHTHTEGISNVLQKLLVISLRPTGGAQMISIISEREMVCVCVYIINLITYTEMRDKIEAPKK